MGQGYFAHFTDIHVGGPRWAEDKGNPILNKMGNDEMKAGIPRHRKAEDHLLGALDELKELNPQPAFVLVTGDIVALGSEGELRRYRKLIENAPVPLYHTPSNHDLWGIKEGVGSG